MAVCICHHRLVGLVAERRSGYHLTLPSAALVNATVAGRPGNISVIFVVGSRMNSIGSNNSNSNVWVIVGVHLTPLFSSIFGPRHKMAVNRLH